ncbi:ATP-binding cassette domain-containing protein [Paenibacillus sp. CAU 1782]
MMLDIEVKDLSVKYGSFTAVDKMSFTLEGGKIYGLLGRNGSGKTSLLSVLASYRKQSSGKLAIGGKDPFENAEIMSQVCFIQENGHMSETYKVKDALKIAADCWPNWDSEIANRLVETYEIPLNKQLQTFSRGMKSMFGVTLGLASRAPITIFDESYLGMDAPSRYIFYDELLASYMASPRSIILSTHLIEEVASLFEELLIVDGGKLLLHENAETFKSRGMLVTGPAMLVEEFASGQKVLGERNLGTLKSVTVYGSVSEERCRKAIADGLELGPVDIQDLFVHMTQKGGVKS